MFFTLKVVFTVLYGAISYWKKDEYKPIYFVLDTDTLGKSSIYSPSSNVIIQILGYFV
ncbi:hypothetical protein [Flavobacterium sp. JP2137]|uniref:hypothetical protein n=1 Tax=Flavobacterium sp. JP2137 TaxID=3414510 RepID=UPI003D2FEB71